MFSWRAPLGATALWALTVLTAIAAVLLLALRPPARLDDDLMGGVGGAAFVLFALAFATVGAMIAARVPGNALGWICLAIGAGNGVGMLAYGYVTYAQASGAHLPATTAAAWLWNPVSQPAAALLGLALMCFPDGRPPSRRWRPAVAAAGLAVVLLAVAPALQAGPLGVPFERFENPLGIPGPLAAIQRGGWVLAIAAMVLGAAAAATRLQRATGDERQQLKFVLGAGTLVASVTAADMSTFLAWPDGHLQARMAVIGLAFALFAVAAGLAILRYRLYDVDVAIERTLVYGALTLVLAATYGLTTLLLGTALGRGSTWATAGATLVVAIAFRPVRAALQDLVDRRFSRARYDALRRVASFLEDLRAGRASPEAIEPLLRELLHDPTLELRFFQPESEVYVDTRGLPADDDPDDPRVRTAVLRAGAPVAVVLHRPTGPGRPDPLATLVEASGLALEIARLRVELRRQLAEVEASRARIVAAGYAERRRIERDLHDGAQQRLVSIGLELRHAQHALEPAAAPALDRAVAELAVAVDELRELARGLPPSQLDAGLQPALHELAGRAPLPVEVRVTTERFTVGLEAAAYFIACEGLTNAIKHAQATSVVLSAQRCNGSLVVHVRDNGVGGARPRNNSGLRGLSDRVAAHGGSLRIESEAAAGTVLTAELPCGS